GREGRGRSRGGQGQRRRAQPRAQDEAIGRRQTEPPGVLASAGVVAESLPSGCQSQSETWTGCIVSRTTSTSWSCSCPRSTSSRNAVLKAASVFSESYLHR